MELIVSHSHTDFDGLAAQLAAQKLYPHALPLLNERLNDNVRDFEMLYHEHLPFVAEEDLPDEPVTRLIVVDTGSPPHLPGLDDETIPTVIIDHHPREREAAPHEQLVLAELGATTSILVQRLIDGRVALSPVEATLLLLGIYEDTGSLSFSSTRPADVACAAWLLEQGARIEAVGEFLRRPLSPEQEQVYHQLESHVRLEEIGDRTVLLAHATTEGEAPQLSTLAEKLRDLYSPAVTALAIGTGTAGTQVILRSNGEALDVGALARGFGGGGHRAAAAAYVRERGAQEVLADLEATIRRQIRPSLTAGDIMTRRVRSAPLDGTVAQAAELLGRYGHSALPVVDGDNVVHGLVSWRDLERATRHGLRTAPLARYMWQGPPLVAPDTPMSAVRAALAAENGQRTGRLLVVDQARRLLGIVTRADVLRVVDPVGAAEEDEGSGEALAAFLDGAVLALLRRAATVAEEQGAALYVVGGTVRDMLLGRPQGDLDLVVEGDAIELAARLAHELGGHVRSHAQFGTATLELGQAEEGEKGRPGDREDFSSSPPLPFSPSPSLLSLDFVMARTEFYEHPSALPNVDAASLRHDLHRRDFTINTLAICLNPSRYGRLYDFYGGRRDIERRLIRVLHNLSFIDDPTRILRAARLAARLDFAIEPRTAALIADALDQHIFSRTTPQRIVNELRLALHEHQPERAVALMDQLGVLRSLHSQLGWSPKLAGQFEAARAANYPDVDLADLYLGIIVYPLDAGAREELIARYQPPAPLARVLRDLSEFAERLPRLRADDLRDSQIDRQLHGLSVAALRVAQTVEPRPVSSAVQHYLEHLRGTKTELDGRFLRQLGLHPGPHFGTLLAELRAARLDGLVQTRADEEAWLRRATRLD